MNTPISPQLSRRIEQAVEELRAEQLDFLKRLVSFPSTLGNEGGAQDLMADTFFGMELEVDRWQLDLDDLSDLAGFSPVDWGYADKANVVGIYRPPEHSGRSLILNGHIDVVPAGPEELWSSPPFVATERGGRLYGRGAGDMKGGIAAYVFALKALGEAGLLPAADIYLQSVVEEECTGNGALATLQRGYKADAVLIPEPFPRQMLTAQVGVMWIEFSLTGKPTHVRAAGEGINAITLAQVVIDDLKELEQAWNDDSVRHPAYHHLDHPLNFSVGKISGGEWPSSVPASCTFVLRISFFPGTPLVQVRQRIEARVEALNARHPLLKSFPVTIRYYGFQAEGCTVDPQAEFMQLLDDTHRQLTGTGLAHLATTATTDARFYALYAGLPVTCYGPEASGIHGIDESLNLDSLHEVTVVLANLIARWCGTVKRPGR